MLRRIEMAERRRHVATQGIDPAQVLVHEPGGKPDPQVLAETPGFAQVSYRGPELAAVPVDDPAVEEDPLHPQVIISAAQLGEGTLIAGEGLIKPAKQLQDCTTLRLGARPLNAIQVHQRGVDLPQRLPRPPPAVQHVGERHPCFRGQGR